MEHITTLWNNIKKLRVNEIIKKTIDILGYLSDVNRYVGVTELS